MRSTLAVVCLVGCVLAATRAAPVPKDFTPDTYYPTALGSKWEYAIEGEKEVRLEVEITKVTREKDQLVLMIEQTSGPKVRDYPEQVRVGPEGVFLLSACELTLTPPRLDLQSKPKENDSWDCQHRWKNFDYTCTTTVGKREKVVTPAGTYNALPHVQKYTNFQPAQEWSAWYAPGVGRVKFINYSGEIHVLLRYTPGREKR